MRDKMRLQSELNDEPLTETICALVDENYDIGRLARVREISGGYCNKNYSIETVVNSHRRRYFLRLYNPTAAKSEILFEHALLNHLRENGFTLAAAVVPCRNGEMLVCGPPPENHTGKHALWAVFEFLEGEDRYSWTETNLTHPEFVSAAEILAHLHHCGHGFTKPQGADRAQPRIMAFIPTFKQTFSGFLKQARNRRCDRLFRDHYEAIENALDRAISFEAGFEGMPEIPIHCDFHPGNLKYGGQEGVGVFDFDWSKIDYRLFDVALALVYFTSIWDDRATGLRADRFVLFLSAYNGACSRWEALHPLTPQERNNLVPMLAIANLYVLNWDLVDFYHTPNPDDDEYYRYIDHNIGLLHWIAAHEAKLVQWVAESQTGLIFGTGK